MRNFAQFFLSAVFVTVLCARSLSAGTIEIVVQDRKGNPVADVVVLAESKSGVALAQPSERPMSFEMDQVDLVFSPHVLVVPVNATVNFLNSDPTAHHVYSFSKTKRFTLPLYKGRAPDPVVFETPGIVTLGCNIHDHMVGYIVVAESHLYARTDSTGKATLAVEGDADNIRVRIWSPRIKDRKKYLVKDAKFTEPVGFTLKKKLNPPHGHPHMESSEWEDY